MVEIHQFEAFVPEDTKYLLLGSFPGRLPQEGEEEFGGFDWYYGTKRNQFWPILEGVYDIKLDTKADKEALFSKLKMALSDVIYSCERKNGTNLDDNLTNITYNARAIVAIFKEHKIETVYFTSHFAHKMFKKGFKKVVAKYPDVKYVTLPSPSPRYADMSKPEKVEKYKELLPKLDNINI